MSAHRPLIERLGLRSPPPHSDGPLPVWMDATEFSQMVAIVEAIEPRVMLEFGSGGSTRAFLERCPYLERYISIEHHRGWYERVRSSISDPRLELHCCEPIEPEPDVHSDRDLREAHAQWCNRAEREPQMLGDYVATGVNSASQFDIVLVDGRAREPCIRECWPKLRSGGVVILHDAQRTEYHCVLHELGRPVFLEPWKDGQVCLLRKP